MSLRRTSVTTRKDTANTNGTACAMHCQASQHIQSATECEAERRLQALDECNDNITDNVHRDANLLSPLTFSSPSARITRRPNGTAVFNVVDVEELSPWSRTIGRVTADQSQQPSHSGKTNNRLRPNAEVISLSSALTMM